MRNLIFLLLLTGCATVTPPVPVPSTTAAADTSGPVPCNNGLSLVNASLWVQSAAEYDAAALQTYNLARRAVDEGLAAADSRPAAVILDLDETAIENMPFEARMVRKGITYDKNDWLSWVNESKGRAVPGAAEFLAYVRSRGVTPFYITNRMQEEEAGTRANLQRLGYPLLGNEDNVLTRAEREEWKSSDKAPRRDWVASRYRVLAVLGDDLNDFANAHDATQEARDEIVRRNAAEWGTRWFIVPNPTYGSWERAIVGSSTGCEALTKKVEALKPN